MSLVSVLFTWRLVHLSRLHSAEGKVDYRQRQYKQNDRDHSTVTADPAGQSGPILVGRGVGASVRIHSDVIRVCR